MFTNTFLCLNLTCLIIVPMVRIELGLFTTLVNITKLFRTNEIQNEETKLN